jgi:hypothetical protein
MADERDEEREEREGDEAFLDVWREWRAGRTRAEPEAMLVWMLANRSPICARVAQRDLRPGA